MTEAFAIVSLAGLALGSFLNSCAYRLPRAISLLTVRSFCPNCGHGISWWGLIPLLGFLLGKGRCESCKDRISLLYPLAELLFAAVVLLLFVEYGPSLSFAISLTFAFLMMLVAIIDARHFVIPNELVVAGSFAGLLFAGVVGEIDEALLSGIGCFLILLAIRIAGNKALSKESMGMGDVKLAGVVGLFTGFVPFLIALWGASIIGTIYGVAKIRNPTCEVRKKFENLNTRSGKIPFGSFLAISSLLVFLFKGELQQLLESWLT